MNKKEIIKRIRDMVKFVESIPDNKLNMNTFGANGVGCALYHNQLCRARKKKVHWTLALEAAIFKRDCSEYVYYMFSTAYDYPEPTGKAAKVEFKKRANELIAQL